MLLLAGVGFGATMIEKADEAKMNTKWSAGLFTRLLWESHGQNEVMSLPYTER